MLNINHILQVSLRTAKIMFSKVSYKKGLETEILSDLYKIHSSLSPSCL